MNKTLDDNLSQFLEFIIKHPILAYNHISQKIKINQTIDHKMVTSLPIFFMKNFQISKDF
jgi:hypothetical protein